MSHRLQVLIPEELDRRIAKAAQRSSVSKGEWVRRVLQEAVEQRKPGRTPRKDPLERLLVLQGPTADIDLMMEEIESGRKGLA